MNPETKSEIQKFEIAQQFNQLIKMDIVEDWLATYADGCRKQKKTTLDLFCDWLNKTPEELLELRRQDQNRTFEKLGLKWLNEMRETKKWASNTAINRLGTIRAFFNFHDLPLRYKRNELPKAKLKPYKFSLNIEHVRRMFQYANSLWIKSLMVLAMETGLRISDLLALRKSDIENLLQQELPSNMELQTKKEGTLARMFLSLEAAEILKLYLPTIPHNDLLFKKDHDTCNKAIQTLFKRAYPNIDFKPTMHDFRRLFISTASNANVNSWHIKLMCGKAVPQDMLPYLRNLDLKTDFIKIKARLTIQPKTNNTPMKAMIETLSEVLIELVRDRMAQKGLTLEKTTPINWEKLLIKLENVV